MPRLLPPALILLAVACLAITPAAITPAAHGQCVRCCFPYANVTVSPTTPEESQAVVVTTFLLNCSSYARVLTATVNVTPNNSACSAYAEALKISAYVYPFRSRTVSYTFSAANCDGTYAVTEKSSNATGYATTSFTVN